jgi:hypothetical protein
LLPYYQKYLKYRRQTPVDDRVINGEVEVMVYESDDKKDVEGYDDEDNTDPGYNGVKDRHDIPPV